VTTEDARQPRLVTVPFLSLMAAALAFFVAAGIVLPVAARFADGPLGADSFGVGVSIGAFAVAALLMRPVVGWSADRYGRRPLLIGGALITVVALLGHLLADSLVLFIAVRSLLGIGEAFLFVAGLAAASDMAPPERRGEAINLLSLSLYVGLAVGPIIGETVLAAAGFDAVWLVAGALAAAAVVLCLLVPETAPGVVAPSEHARGRARLIHPAALFPGFLILTGAWGMAGFLAFLPLHATEIGMDGAGVPLGLYATLVVILRIWFMKLPDQVGPAPLSGAALAVSAVGLALIGLLDVPVGLLIGAAVYAAGIAFMFPALMALAVSRVGPTERGSVVGTASAFLDVAFGLGPATLGALAGVVGFGGSFLVSAGISAMGFLLLVARRRTLARPVPA
jgi:MFS family permease